MPIRSAFQSSKDVCRRIHGSDCVRSSMAEYTIINSARIQTRLIHRDRHNKNVNTPNVTACRILSLGASEPKAKLGQCVAIDATTNPNTAMIRQIRRPAAPSCGIDREAKSVTTRRFPQKWQNLPEIQRVSTVDAVLQQARDNPQRLRKSERNQRSSDRNLSFCQFYIASNRRSQHNRIFPWQSAATKLRKVIIHFFNDCFAMTGL